MPFITRCDRAPPPMSWDWCLQTWFCRTRSHNDRNLHAEGSGVFLQCVPGLLSSFGLRFVPGHGVLDEDLAAASQKLQHGQEVVFTVQALADRHRI